MNRPPDVVVVGGGVVGAACARALARRAYRVVVCEPGPLAGAASPASAGMLSAQIEPDELLLALGVRARDFYPTLAEELLAGTGIDIGLWRDGILSVAFDDARADTLQASVALQRQAGLRCDWLTADEVRERWPGVAPQCVGALHAPEDGALDPAALTRALLADAVARGTVIQPLAVTEILTNSGRASGVRAGQETIPAAHVVLAAGAWSAAIAGPSQGLPVEPVRGQLVSQPWPAKTARVVAFHGHHYVLARGDSAISGTTMERVGFDSSVTPDGIAAIGREAARLLPGLGGKPVARSWAGLRPLTPDGRPILGPETSVEGLWYATGHGRQGVLLAGLTGEIVADLVATGTTEADISALLPRQAPAAGGG